MSMRRDVTNSCSFLDAEQVRAATFVRHVELHEVLGSTNDRAADLARDAGIERPALVAARLQTAGRGRGRNIWWATDGALTFSLLLDGATTGIEPNDWPKLSIAAAVAACDAFGAGLSERVGAPSRMVESGRYTVPIGLGDAPTGLIKPSEFQIKWPNDVLLGGRKVCGILIESPGGPGPGKNCLILGIGVNVNNSWRDAPEKVKCNATALCDVIGRKFDLQHVLIDLLNSLSFRIHQLRSRDRALVHDLQRLDYLAGRRVVLECEGRRISGSCREIAGDGALVMDTSSGRQRFYSGSIQLV
jgi:BirA family biotin operon repressor/biotin-[acetyl-CoA-carboxylase] ligase